MPGSRATQLGLHRARVRTRLPEDRQDRAAAPGGRLSGRHPLPDAGRRSTAPADRCRRGGARPAPPSGGAAAPGGRARIGTSTAGGRTRPAGRSRVPGGQRRRKRRRSGDARSGSAPHAPVVRTRGDPGVCLHPAGARDRVPCRSRGRAGRHLHPDDSADSGREPPQHLDDGTARPFSPARGGIGRARGVDEQGHRVGARGLPDASGHQPRRALAGALRGGRRRPPRGVLPILRGCGRRARDLHDAPRSARRDSRSTGTIISRRRSSLSSPRSANP